MVSAYKLGQLARHVFWPVSCPICGKIASPACPVCLLGLAENLHRQFCVECFGSFPCSDHPEGIPLSYMASFRGKSRDLVHMLKYGSRRELGRLMGRAMGEIFPSVRDVLLVPVPLHAGSARTFNQSMELAKGMSEVWGVDVGDALEWRISRTSQVGLPSTERKSMPQSAMGWKGRPARNVCIVDDVCTTGATLRCASSAVMASGGTVAGVFAWALTPGI